MSGSSRGLQVTGVAGDARLLLRRPGYGAGATVLAVTAAALLEWTLRHQLTHTAEIGAAAAVAWLVSYEPRPFLLAVPVLLPSQLFALSFLYREGVDRTIVKGLGYWVEVVVAGAAIAALRSGRRRGNPALDWVDWAAIGYVALVAVYRLSPTLFVHGGFPPPTDSTVLNTALRNDTLYVIAFVAVRHLEFSRAQRTRFCIATLSTGVVVAGIAIFEHLQPAAWDHFALRVIGVRQFQRNVLGGVFSSNTVLIRTPEGTHSVLRSGSLFADELQCAFFLLACLAVGVELLMQRRRHWALLGATVGVVATGLVLTQTRDAALGAVIILGLASLRRPGRQVDLQKRLFRLVGVGLAALLALAVSVGLAGRLYSLLGNREKSAAVHASSLSSGLRTLIHAPLGRGLGTGAINGTRFAVAGTRTSENQFLQISGETGVVSLAFFLTLTFGVGRTLWKRSSSAPSEMAAAWSSAYVALSAAGMFLQVWLAPAVAVVVWTGAAIGVSPSGDASPADSGGQAGPGEETRAAAPGSIGA